VIVERCTYTVKNGRTQEAADVIKQLWSQADSSVVHRIYTPIIGPYDVVYQEIEFVDMEARTQFSATAPTDPMWDELIEKWRALRVSGGGSEILRLAE
jgi:hypothetical protein